VSNERGVRQLRTGDQSDEEAMPLDGLPTAQRLFAKLAMPMPSPAPERLNRPGRRSTGAPGGLLTPRETGPAQGERVSMQSDTLQPGGVSEYRLRDSRRRGRTGETVGVARGGRR